MASARWVFLRAYLLVASLVFVVGLGLELLLESRHTEAIELRESTLLQGGFLYAQSIRIPSTDAGRVKYTKQLASDLQLPVQIYPIGDFRQLEHSFAQLQSGASIRLFNDSDRAVYYRMLEPGEWVLALGPAPELDSEQAYWVVPLFYTLIAVAVFLWVRPVMRDIEVLQESASAFGQQDFSTRVAIPEVSWLAPLGQAFNSMAVRIQWLLQSHRELTHAVSHELRTPLARIRFSLEMLGQGDEESIARHRESINRDIEDLNTLIDEMLSYAELDQEHLRAKLEPLAIRNWLEEYVDGDNQNQAGIPLHLILPGAIPPVLADERLMRRALDNLVGNARRYACEYIAIRLTLRDGVCQLQVEDDGPGIPEHKRAAVTSAFTRLEDEGGAVSHGFGLGLAIVKRIMDLHHGQVAIDSSVQGGAAIGLRWPA